MCIKSGSVAPYITLQNVSHDLKSLEDSFKCESRLKSMRKDLAPYPARPPLTLLANRENSFLRMATPKAVLVDCSQLLSLLH